MTNEVYISDKLEGIGAGDNADCLAHALCLGGSAAIKFNGKDYVLKKGDLMIVRNGRLIESIEPSPDFKVKVMYATPEFIYLAAPRSNYGTKGALGLFLNPIMHLTKEQFKVCRRDYEMLQRRLSAHANNFYEDILVGTVHIMILDFYDFHSKIYGPSDTSSQNACLVNDFIDMLEGGTYREHREVTYYADKLCVTPKYLSEIAKRVSGYGANYWINRYTILDIKRLLRDKSVPFTQIAEMFNFSSPAYFSRYVQSHLGLNPTQYRK